jgi:hypothetical protein
MTRPELPPTARTVANHLKPRLGERTQALAYYDVGERNVVAVVQAVGSPHETLTTYSTASLHTTANQLDEADIRVELLMVGRKEDEEVANVVATSAFCVMKDGWLAAPGVVFPTAVSEYFPSTTVPHVMWTEPFDFDGLSAFTVPGVERDLHALQGVPLSEAEYRFLLDNGFYALHELLIQAGVLHFDLFRASAC